MKHLLQLIVSGCLLVSLSACAGPTPPAPPDPPPPTGSLRVAIEGLPAGTDGDVVVTGPDGFATVLAATTTLDEIAPGSYEVVPRPVASAGNLYRGRAAAVVVSEDATAEQTVRYRLPSVLFWSDALEASEVVLPALEATGHAVASVASGAEVDARLASGGYDLVVLLNQTTPAVEVGLEPLRDYIAGGGAAVLVDYNRSAAYGAVFDATFTGTTNNGSGAAPLLADLLDPDLAAGVANPIGLVVAGYAVIAMGLEPAAGGVSVCRLDDADSCLVIGNDGRTALLGFVGDAVPPGDIDRFYLNLSLALLDL